MALCEQQQQRLCSTGHDMAAAYQSPDMHSPVARTVDASHNPADGRRTKMSISFLVPDSPSPTPSATPTAPLHATSSSTQLGPRHSSSPHSLRIISQPWPTPRPQLPPFQPDHRLPTPPTTRDTKFPGLDYYAFNHNQHNGSAATPPDAPPLLPPLYRQQSSSDYYPSPSTTHQTHAAHRTPSFPPPPSDFCCTHPAALSTISTESSICSNSGIPGTSSGIDVGGGVGGGGGGNGSLGEAGVVALPDLSGTSTNTTTSTTDSCSSPPSTSPKSQQRPPRPCYSEEQKFFIMYARISLAQTWPAIERKFASLFGPSSRRSKGGLTSVYYRVRKEWGLVEVLQSAATDSTLVDQAAVEAKAKCFSREVLREIGYPVG